MVSRKEKNRMTTFIANCIEDSGLYQIVAKAYGRIHVIEKPFLREIPKEIHVLAHTQRMKEEDFNSLQSKARADKVSLAHIFYKDGKNFMVRLAARGNIKYSRSLKRFTKKTIDSMIHLRTLEKLCLEDHSRLAFYQPKTQRLAESIRIYDMLDVETDYSHVKPGDLGHGHATNRITKDYKIILETATLKGSMSFLFPEAGNLAVPNPLSQTDKDFRVLLGAEDGSYEKDERGAIFLDSCTERELKYLTRRFGEKVLGLYAIPSPT